MDGPNPTAQKSKLPIRHDVYRIESVNDAANQELRSKDLLNKVLLHWPL